MNSISITIPIEYNTLTRVSDMLHGMAIDLSKESLSTETTPEPAPATEATPEPAPATEATPEPAPATEATLPMVNPGVELDAEPDSLPYDVRIHTKGKIKKLKKTGKWKYARNVTPELIKTVEAELRAVMAASPARLIETVKNPIDDVEYQVSDVSHIPIDDIIPSPMAQVDKYAIEGKEYTAEQLRKTGWTDQQMIPYLVNNKPLEIQTNANMIFPELMAKITHALGAGIITQESLLAALNKQRLASLPLLAARPDLITAVNDELFVF